MLSCTHSHVQTVLHVKCVCGHCEGVREVLEAQQQMTNCDSTCPRTLKPFRYETTKLFDGSVQPFA